MTELMEIQSFIQAYVQAVTAIMETDVTVVDSEFVRVAGTGDYSASINENISHGAFFEKVISATQPGIFKSIREDYNCAACEKAATCKELANVGYPIFINGKVVGLIGIIAFDEKTKQSLLSKSDTIEEFLKYMSQLIESKITTHRISVNLKNQLEEIISSENKFLSEFAFLGSAPSMQSALKIIKKVSPSESTVLLTGESGTGKEIFAKLIHSQSAHANKLMISLNCAAIPENLVESELFGYDEGAFTGAKKGGNVGKFELANGSTIFLDEIGEMPLQTQAKILRVLQEKSIQRIGSKKEIPIDVRVICATNCDLMQMVENGTFRRDLYYRLNVIPINVPPLRERKSDIMQLTYSIVKEFSKKLRKEIVEITPNAQEMLTSYPWPGNVRELRNVIEYTMNMSETNVIDAEDLPAIFQQHTIKDETATLDEMMAVYEKKIIETLLKNYSDLDNKDELAKKLGISRATLYRKLSEYKLT